MKEFFEEFIDIKIFFTVEFSLSLYKVIEIQENYNNNNALKL